MISNNELYGTEKVPPIPEDVANERIYMLNERLKYILSLPFEEQSPYTIKKIEEGISFWKKVSGQEDFGF